MAQYREVLEEPPFTAAIAEIAKQYPRASEVVDALTWSLGRAPEQHPQVPGTRHHLVKTFSFEGVPEIPPLRVLYRFDEDHVFLMAAMLATETLGREP
jgi:hypothetical protein